MRSAFLWLRVRVMKEVVTMKMPLKCILTKTSDLEDDKWVSQEPVRSVGESRESEAWQKVFMLRSKLTSFFHKPVEESMARPRRDSGVVFDIMAKQRESEELSHCFEQEKDLLSAGRTDSEAEIARLTSLLHVKNLEYRKASRELEETKAVLSLVRAKQSADMAQAKLMAVEKDLRLQAAEQAVDSLKLTQVDWWGEGSRVELAGSFNGWKSHFYLLPDLSSKALLMLPGTRSPLLWRTELWLYPGVYEIKFIVDGNWVIDDRREIVQGNLDENNLLYVEP
ncbi:uncharacterized protein [Physcomitrium patens]|uniref:uncharacterized protein n=1 Tax=Physcomitrium patens TaxID=3218 RepID=UPI003CCCB09D